jgi:hypothetical protein
MAAGRYNAEMPRGRSNRTDRARATFLQVLEDTCNVAEAARQAGMSRRSAYDWRDADPVFAADWKDAEEAAADKLEQVAFERAKSGLSDRMLEILLKGHRPKYRDKHQVDHGVTDQAAALIREGMTAKKAAEAFRDELG